MTPLLAAGATALAIPGLALAAGSGGAGTEPGSGSGGSGNAPASPSVSTGNIPVTASGDGITITSRASAFLRPGLSVTGSVAASKAGDTVEIDQLAAGNAWAPATTATVQPGGSFAATWRPSHPGQLTIRALVTGTQASSAAAAPTLSVTVYRRSRATLYGPGFYGDRTACGTVLRRRTIGVANRTLPCGTPVQIYYKGRVITVPVIDRGPYAHGANWDLTMATGRALGMLGTATIGAAAIPSATNTTTATIPAAPSAQ